MTKRTKNVGYDSGNSSSDRFLSPKKPYAGDGKTKRTIFDRVTVVFKSGKKKPGKSK